MNMTGKVGKFFYPLHPLRTSHLRSDPSTIFEGTPEIFPSLTSAKNFANIFKKIYTTSAKHFFKKKFYQKKILLHQQKKSLMTSPTHAHNNVN